MAEEKIKKTKEDKALNEIGFSGVEFSGYDIDWEWQKKLRSLSSRINNYKQMRSDSSVDAALKLVEYPMMTCNSIIVPASEDPEHILHADFARDNLINESNISMSYSYLDHRQERSKFMQYGFYPFEKVNEIRDWIRSDGEIMTNMVSLRKLAPRFPGSIYGWKFKEGGVESILQNQPMDENSLPKGAAKNSEGYIEIPVRKIVNYVNDRIGDNWEGISILRPMFKHWSYKEGFYKLEAIGLQKNAVGFITIGLDTVNDDIMTKWKKIVRSHMVNDEMGMIYRKDKEVIDFKQGGIESDALHKAINHHDAKILQAVLAGFLLLGLESRGGARNLGASLIELFMMSVEYKMAMVDQIENRFVVQGLINNNFTNVRVYPKIKSYVGRIVDKEIMSKIIDMLVKNGLLNSNDPTTKDYIYTIFGIPTTEEIYKKSFEVPKITDDETNFEPEISIRKEFPNTKNDEELNRFRQKWVPVTFKIIDKQKRELSSRISNLIKLGVVPNINYIETPYMDVYDNLLREYSNVMSNRFPEFAMDEFDLKRLSKKHDVDLRCKMLEKISKI